MDILDVVDENDQVVGQATKKEAWEKKLRRRIVHVLIFNCLGEIALQLRSASMFFCPSCWSTSVGGHVHSGESYEVAAKREMMEEIVIDTKLEFVSKDLYIVDKLEMFLTTYRTTYDGPFHINPKEIAEVRFFPLDEVCRMLNDGTKLHPELVFLLKKHLMQ